MQKQLSESYSASASNTTSINKHIRKSKSLQQAYPLIPGISSLIGVLLLVFSNFGACRAHHSDEIYTTSSEDRSSRLSRRKLFVSEQKVSFGAFTVVVAPTTRPLTSTQSAQVADAVKSSLLDEFNNEYIYGSVEFKEVYLFGDPNTQWIEGSQQLRNRRKLQLSGPRTIFYFLGGEALFAGPSALTPSTNTVNREVLDALKGRLTGQLNLLGFSFADVVSGKATDQPTSAPSLKPIPLPSTKPTTKPSSQPTFSPISSSTSSPTLIPTEQPTPLLTSSPSLMQTEQPTLLLTSSPSLIQTEQPTPLLTSNPSLMQTEQPLSAPTLLPIVSPTNKPSTTKPTLASSPPTMLPTSLSTRASNSLLSTSPSTISLTLMKLSSMAPSQGVVDSQRPTVTTMKANAETVVLKPTPTINTSSTASFPTMEKSDQPTNNDQLSGVIGAPAQETTSLSNKNTTTTLSVAVGCLAALTLISAAIFSRSNKNTKQWNTDHYVDDHDTPMTMEVNMAKVDMQPTYNSVTVSLADVSDLENEKAPTNCTTKNSAMHVSTDKQPIQHLSSVTVISSDYSVSTAHTDYDDESDWSPRSSPSVSSFVSKYSKHSMGREESFEVVRHMAHALQKDMLCLTSEGVGYLANTTSGDPGKEYDKHGDSALAPTNFTASSIKGGSIAKTRRSHFSFAKKSIRPRTKQETTRQGRASRSPVHNGLRKRDHSANSAGSSNGAFEEDSAWNPDDNEDDSTCANNDAPFVYDNMKSAAEDDIFT